MKIKLLIPTLILGLLSACAPSDSNDQDASYHRENEKLQSEFSAVTGTYRGTLRAQKNTSEFVDVPIQAMLYVVYVNSGKDSQGQAVMTPALKMRYRQEDIVRPDDMLSVRYTKDNGSFYATEPGSSVSLNGVATGNTMSGSVNRGGGTLGNFVLTLETKNVNVPLSDSEDLLERLDAQNRRIQGIYLGEVTGKMHPEGYIIPSFPVRLELKAEFTINENGVRIAVLTGRYSRPDFVADPTAGVRFFKNVVFRENTFPPQLAMKSEGGSAQMPNSYYMLIIGTLSGNIFEGTMADSIGTGNIRLVKQP